MRTTTTPKASKQATFILDAPKDTLDRWELAARSCDHDLAEWIADRLDSASQSNMEQATTPKARAARKSATELPTVSIRRSTHSRLIKLAEKNNTTACMLLSCGMDYILDEMEAGRMCLSPCKPD